MTTETKTREIQPAEITKQKTGMVEFDQLAAYNTMMTISTALWKSGMFPNVKSAEGAFAVICLGHEHGIPPMTSLMTINIIEGKPSYAGELIQAKLQAGGVVIRPVEWDDKHCILEFSGRGYAEQFEFNENDAKKMGKLPAKPGSNWAKDPKDMFWWRALTRGARRYAPDMIHGLHIPDEVQDIVETERAREAARPKIGTLSTAEMKPGNVADHQDWDDREPETNEINCDELVKLITDAEATKQLPGKGLDFRVEILDGADLDNFEADDLKKYLAALEELPDKQNEDF